MPIEIDFTGQVALVTGAATGLGLATAQALGQAGASVAVVDLTQERAERTAADLGAAGVTARGWAADVRDGEAIRRVVDEAAATFGRLDVAVANAGVYPNAPFLDMDEDEWRRVIDTNLTGVFLTCQAAARAMVRAGGGGRLVTLSSGAANHAIWGWSHYSASKAGVVALTRGMALELAPHGIRVNAVLPGFIDVPEGGAALSESYRQASRAGIPLRLGAPEDIANAVVLLASSLAGFVTGTSLVVDGGSSAGRVQLRPVEG
ncbi:MAG TPA: SDR family NAD(P)-dependent oxidoreductase [Thermomicrobiaceae bacterium]|nr:SDR family NAD(P)-dependent oxidoreductase [Thermomicrobiaceae bacterium]